MERGGDGCPSKYKNTSKNPTNTKGIILIKFSLRCIDNKIKLNNIISVSDRITKISNIAKAIKAYMPLRDVSLMPFLNIKNKKNEWIVALV